MAWRDRTPGSDGESHAVFFLTPDGTIDNWTRAAETVYRYATEEVLGEPFDELWAELPRRVDGMPELLERATHDEVRIRHHHHQGDGSTFLAECTMWPVRNGQLHGYAVVSHDVERERGSRPLDGLGVERENLADLFSERLQSPL